MRFELCLVLSIVTFGCGGSEKPAESPPTDNAKSESAPAADAAATESAAAAAAEKRSDVPEQCAKEGDICLPDPKFVKALCADTYPDVALVLFSKNRPFSHGFLTRKTKAWNASGGVSDNEAMLEFDEEVVLLQKRGGPSGGMQVSGAMGGFDALRWDGSCVTLAQEEVTTNKPPAAKTARIDWRFLGKSMQEGLRENPKIDETYIARKKECKGVSSGDVSLKCVKLDEKLTQVIATHVRDGGKLGEPGKTPEW
jgi:hypothetical protein